MLVSMLVELKWVSKDDLDEINFQVYDLVEKKVEQKPGFHRFDVSYMIVS